MKQTSPIFYPLLSKRYKTEGFTLLELLVVLAITSIISVGIITHYRSQIRAYRIQRELAHMQQNLRAAMYMMQSDIRNCGRDPLRTGRYGIQSVIRANVDADDANGYAGLTMSRLIDVDNNGSADTGQVQVITYQVLDTDGDGRRELERCVDGACTQLVDGIEDISFAYAVDDGNGDLARVGANAEIWAIDTTNNNILDSHLDVDGNGNINIADGVPAALAATVPLNRIRVVRVWVLARSRQTYPDYTDNHTYVVGNKVLDMTAPANANRRNFRHLMLTSAVALQNFQLDTNL